jgi:hypothetical protein
MRFLLAASVTLLVACGATQFKTNDPYADGGTGEEMDAGATGGGSAGGGTGGGTGGGNLGGGTGGGTTGGGTGGGTTGGGSGGGTTGGGTGGGTTGGGGGATGGGTGGGATGGGSGGTCTPANCASGCCAAGVCQTGTTTTQCGKLGVACAACGTMDICKADQTCGLDPTATWRARPSAAEIAATKSSGANWDLATGPDTQLGVWCPDTMPRTRDAMPTIDDDYYPTWTTGGCTATAAQFLASGLGFDAVEIDSGGNDPMTSFTITPITEAQLRAGTKTITFAGGLDSLTIRFTKE